MRFHLFQMGLIQTITRLLPDAIISEVEDFKSLYKAILKEELDENSAVIKFLQKMLKSQRIMQFYQDCQLIHFGQRIMIV